MSLPDFGAVTANMDRFYKRPELDVERAMTAIDGMRRPDLIAGPLSVVTAVAQRAEANVGTGEGIITQLPAVRDEGHPLWPYFERWVPDENRHAEVLGHLMEHAGLRIVPPRDPDNVPALSSVIGNIAGRSTRVHRTVEMVASTFICATEALTSKLYGAQQRFLEEHGEHDVAGAVFGQIRTDEAFHLGSAREYGKYVLGELAPWQHRLAREIVVHNWAPVGTGEPEGKAAFGEAVLQIAELTSGEDTDDPRVIAELDAATHALAERRQRRGIETVIVDITTGMYREAEALLDPEGEGTVIDFVSPKIREAVQAARDKRPPALVA